jgi:hypothetical protein
MDEEWSTNLSDKRCVVGENTNASGVYFNVERDRKGLHVADGCMPGCKPRTDEWLACFAGLDGIV